MFHIRLAAPLILASLAAFAMPPGAGAQKPAEPDKKEQDAIQRVQKLLDQVRIETKDLQKEMPLAKFLEAVEKQLPKDEKISLRLDKEAFGDKFDEVAATRVTLPAFWKGTATRRWLREVVRLAITSMKAEGFLGLFGHQADYRIEPTQIVITTPERALYTAVYDIRDLVGKPDAWTLDPSFNPFMKDLPQRKAEPARGAAEIVQTLASSTELLKQKPAKDGRETIQIINGTRLLIQTNGATHAEVAAALDALRVHADQAVFLEAKLLEVSHAVYQRYGKKRYTVQDIDEWERKFLEGKLPEEKPWPEKEKPKLVLAGEKVKLNNGGHATLLSRHRVVTCLPTPEQVIKEESPPRQTILEGVSFLARVQISGDRRSVWIKLTEKTTELKAINKMKVPATQVDNEIKWAEAELPIVDETQHMRGIIIPDGGTVVVPVLSRPSWALGKDRWWILSIHPTIYIEAEERVIREGGLKETLAATVPLIVADVLKNPRLKATRDFYGTPGDKRFALVNSEAWTWPKEEPPKVAGFELTPAKREGKRLLGIRLDKYEWTGKDGGDFAVTVTLVNAGGSDNGPVIGGCTLRYIGRRDAKDWTWTVALAEP